jgi:uncharacterized protein YecE (DUF72 family)
MGSIYVGTAGFSYPDWKGIVYPRDLKKRKLHELEYLAEFFDCCEINSSYYRHLDPKISAKWCDYVARVNPGFLFTVKLHKNFTHAPNAKQTSTSAETLKFTRQDVDDAKAGIAPFVEASRLGAVLVQFPISFRHTEGNWDYLSDLLRLFAEYPLALEVRHKSWAEPAALGELESRNIAFCNIDQTRLGDTLEGTAYVTAPVAYMRLHGRSKKWFSAKDRDERYDYLYSPEQIEKIGEKVKQMSPKAERSFVVTNNHYKGQAAANAIELKKLLTGKPVKVPSELQEHYPDRV